MTDMGFLGAVAAQAMQEGAAQTTVRALVEEAAEFGAERALARLGLNDLAAMKDLREVRDLLDAWRAAKRAATHAVIGWLFSLIMIGFLCLVALKLKLLQSVFFK